MAQGKTLLIIKPDAVQQKLTGKILSQIEAEGFTILTLKSAKLSQERAGEFYSVHRGKPFYEDLVDFMSSGTIVVCLLEREAAVTYLREVVGATDPAEAKSGTLRQQFGTSVRENAVHASDSIATASQEIAFFFST